MICEAILKIKSDAQVSVSGTDIDTCIIEWHDGNPTNITKEQIKSKIDETAYEGKRAKEYPSLKEFAEAYTEKEIGADTTKWDEYVIKYNKVRTDNPK
jgi:PAB1-binding protein PBP1